MFPRSSAKIHLLSWSKIPPQCWKYISSYQDRDFYSLDNLCLIVWFYLVHRFEEPLNGWLFPHEFLETKISNIIKLKITDYNYMQIRNFQDVWQYIHKAQLPQLLCCANKSGMINLISRPKLTKMNLKK